MSANLSVTVRFDFESVVQSRYDRNDIAAAMAALPCTTACSPYTIVLPGAETMKGGASGFESFRLYVLLGEERRDEGVVGVFNVVASTGRLPICGRVAISFTPFVRSAPSPFVSSCFVPFMPVFVQSR